MVDCQNERTCPEADREMLCPCSGRVRYQKGKQMNIEDDPNYDIQPAARARIEDLKSRLAAAEKERDEARQARAEAINEIGVWSRKAGLAEARADRLEKELKAITPKDFGADLPY